QAGLVGEPGKQSLSQDGDTGEVISGYALDQAPVGSGLGDAPRSKGGPEIPTGAAPRAAPPWAPPYGPARGRADVGLLVHRHARPPHELRRHDALPVSRPVASHTRGASAAA
ncbi:hypothetical protein, partial [Clavibacter michiganensis]|uniref:hypothetical protein n=1 Tax=Clavibacter michiganensis TaxID=28447 RepID=UPI00292CB0F0